MGQAGKEPGAARGYEGKVSNEASEPRLQGGTARGQKNAFI